MKMVFGIPNCFLAAEARKQRWRLNSRWSRLLNTTTAAIVEYSEVPELQITVVDEMLLKCW